MDKLLAKLTHSLTVCNQLPGYFLFKDLNSKYIAGCLKTAKLFGFKHTDDLVGITDHGILCPAADYAHLFTNQDEKVKKISAPILVLDVHLYANNELKTLLINKTLLTDEQHNPIGISCYCIEIDKAVLKNLALQLVNNDPLRTNAPKQAVNYYLNSDYPDIDLSRRQAECLFYVLRGKTAKQIAKRLTLSHRTVEGYLDDIRYKMGCHNKSELIDRAIEKGFFEIVPTEIFRNKLGCLFLKND